MKIIRRMAFLMPMLLGYPAFCDEPPPFNPGDPSPIPVNGGVSILLFLLILVGIIAGIVVLVITSGKNQNEAVPNTGVGTWLLQYLVASIPVIGFIILIIWAFDNSNKLRKNWAAATLIWMIITLILAIFFGGIILVKLLSLYPK